MTLLKKVAVQFVVLVKHGVSLYELTVVRR